MKSIRDNSYDIVRLIINQVGISIFALVLYTSLGFVAENDEGLADGLRTIFSLFSIVFYWALLYTMMWEIGAKDIIKIEGGKLVDVKGKGAILGFVANLPNIIISLLVIVFCSVFIFTNNDIFGNLFFIFNLIMRLFAAMYIGVASFVFSPISQDTYLLYLLQSICFLVLPFITVGVCQVGYILGKRNFKFIFKNK